MHAFPQLQRNTGFQEVVVPAGYLPWWAPPLTTATPAPAPAGALPTPASAPAAAAAADAYFALQSLCALPAAACIPPPGPGLLPLPWADQIGKACRWSGAPPKAHQVRVAQPLVPGRGAAAAYSLVQLVGAPGCPTPQLSSLASLNPLGPLGPLPPGANFVLVGEASSGSATLATATPLLPAATPPPGIIHLLPPPPGAHPHGPPGQPPAPSAAQGAGAAPAPAHGSAAAPAPPTAAAAFLIMDPGVVGDLSLARPPFLDQHQHPTTGQPFPPAGPYFVQCQSAPLLQPNCPQQHNAAFLQHYDPAFHPPQSVVFAQGSQSAFPRADTQEQRRFLQKQPGNFAATGQGDAPFGQRARDDPCAFQAPRETIFLPPSRRTGAQSSPQAGAEPTRAAVPEHLRLDFAFDRSSVGQLPQVVQVNTTKSQESSVESVAAFTGHRTPCRPSLVSQTCSVTSGNDVPRDVNTPTRRSGSCEKIGDDSVEDSDTTGRRLECDSRTRHSSSDSSLGYPSDMERMVNRLVNNSSTSQDESEDRASTRTNAFESRGSAPGMNEDPPAQTAVPASAPSRTRGRPRTRTRVDRQRRVTTSTNGVRAPRKPRTPREPNVDAQRAHVPTCTPNEERSPQWLQYKESFMRDLKGDPAFAAAAANAGADIGNDDTMDAERADVFRGRVRENLSRLAALLPSRKARAPQNNTVNHFIDALRVWDEETGPGSGGLRPNDCDLILRAMEETRRWMENPLPCPERSDVSIGKRERTWRTSASRSVHIMMMAALDALTAASAMRTTHTQTPNASLQRKDGEELLQLDAATGMEEAAEPPPRRPALPRVGPSETEAACDISPPEEPRPPPSVRGRRGSSTEYTDTPRTRPQQPHAPRPRRAHPAHRKGASGERGRRGTRGDAAPDAPAPADALLTKTRLVNLNRGGAGRGKSVNAPYRPPTPPIRAAVTRTPAYQDRPTRGRSKTKTSDTSTGGRSGGRATDRHTTTTTTTTPTTTTTTDRDSSEEPQRGAYIKKGTYSPPLRVPGTRARAATGHAPAPGAVAAPPPRTPAPAPAAAAAVPAAAAAAASAAPTTVAVVPTAPAAVGRAPSSAEESAPEGEETTAPAPDADDRASAHEGDVEEPEDVQRDLAPGRKETDQRTQPQPAHEESDVRNRPQPPQPATETTTETIRVRNIPNQFRSRIAMDIRDRETPTLTETMQQEILHRTFPVDPQYGPFTRIWPDRARANAYAGNVNPQPTYRRVNFAEIPHTNRLDRENDPARTVDPFPPPAHEQRTTSYAPFNTPMRYSVVTDNTSLPRQTSSYLDHLPRDNAPTDFSTTTQARQAYLAEQLQQGGNPNLIRRLMYPDGETNVSRYDNQDSSARSGYANVPQRYHINNAVQRPVASDLHDQEAQQYNGNSIHRIATSYRTPVIAESGRREWIPVRSQDANFQPRQNASDSTILTTPQNASEVNLPGNVCRRNLYRFVEPSAEPSSGMQSMSRRIDTVLNAPGYLGYSGSRQQFPSATFHQGRSYEASRTAATRPYQTGTASMQRGANGPGNCDARGAYPREVHHHGQEWTPRQEQDANGWRYRAMQQTYSERPAARVGLEGAAPRGQTNGGDRPPPDIPQTPRTFSDDAPEVEPSPPPREPKPELSSPARIAARFPPYEYSSENDFKLDTIAMRHAGNRPRSGNGSMRGVRQSESLMQHVNCDADSPPDASSSAKSRRSSGSDEGVEFICEVIRSKDKRSRLNPQFVRLLPKVEDRNQYSDIIHTTSDSSDDSEPEDRFDDESNSNRNLSTQDLERRLPKCLVVLTHRRDSISKEVNAAIEAARAKMLLEANRVKRPADTDRAKGDGADAEGGTSPDTALRLTELRSDANKQATETMTAMETALPDESVGKRPAAEGASSPPAPAPASTPVHTPVASPVANPGVAPTPATAPAAASPKRKHEVAGLRAAGAGDGDSPFQDEVSPKRKTTEECYSTEQRGIPSISNSTEFPYELNGLGWTRIAQPEGSPLRMEHQPLRLPHEVYLKMTLCLTVVYEDVPSARDFFFTRGVAVVDRRGSSNLVDLAQRLRTGRYITVDHFVRDARRVLAGADAARKRNPLAVPSVTSINAARDKFETTLLQAFPNIDFTGVEDMEEDSDCSEHSPKRNYRLAFRHEFLERICGNLALPATTNYSPEVMKKVSGKKEGGALCSKLRTSLMMTTNGVSSPESVLSPDAEPRTVPSKPPPAW